MPTGWAYACARQLLEELHDNSNSTTAVLLPCGEKVVSSFRRITAATLERELLHEDASAELEKLINDAYTRLSDLGIPSLCWSRLFTDACIWRTIADILFIDELLEDTALSCVARLDRAIIVAGPSGQGRLELIHDLIYLIQSTFLGFVPSLARSFQSPRLINLTIPDITLPKTFAKPIPRLDTLPSLASFVSKYSKAPFIIPGYTKDWPAMNEHPWLSPDYLRAVTGPGRIVPVEVGVDYRSDDWTQAMMGWDDFLSAIFSPDNSCQKKPVLYLAQHNLFRQFPALRDDMFVPDYVYASLPPTEDYPGYRPPGNEEQLVVNAWFGPKGTVSPAHIDPFHNFFAQVEGRKVAWLAPPSISSSIYTYPPRSSSPESDSESAKAYPHRNHPATNNVEPSLSNTSRVDVFSDDQSAFPLFEKNVIPEAMCSVVEPGDLLYFPAGWWHAMRGESVSFSVTMWF